MELIDTIGEIEIYQTTKGRGVVFITNQKRGNNAAIFETLGEALSIALAAAWGGSIRLTHRIKSPQLAKTAS